MTAGALHAGDGGNGDTAAAWLTGSVSLEAASRYILSGGDDAHSSPVLNDSLELDAYDFSLILASHVAFQKTYQETDAGLGYGKTLGPVSLSLGYSYDYIVHGPDKSLHDFSGSASLPFATYYTAALNVEATAASEVGAFTELLVTADYPVIQDKVDFSPYFGWGYASQYSSGASVGASGSVERFGFNVPITLTKNWGLNFQLETVFSRQLDGQVWVGTRVTYSF